MGLLSGLLHGQARFFSGPYEVPLVGLPERQPYSGSGGRGGTRDPAKDSKDKLPLAIQSHKASAIASRAELDKEEAMLSAQYRKRAMTLSTSEFYDDPFVKEYAGKMADIEARKMYGEMYEGAIEPYYIQVDDFSKEIRDKDAGGTEILIENKKGGYTRTRTNYNEYIRNIYEDVTREKSSVFNEETGRYEYKPPTQKPILAVDESGQFMQTINDLMDDAQAAKSVSGGKIKYTNKQMTENSMLRFMQMEQKVITNVGALGNMTDDVWDQLADKSVKKDAYRSYFNAVDEGYQFKEDMVKKYMEAHGKKTVTEDDYVKMYAFDIASGNAGGRTVYGKYTTEKFDTGLYGATKREEYVGYNYGMYVKTTEPSSRGNVIYTPNESGKMIATEVPGLQNFANPGNAYDAVNKSLIQVGGKDFVEMVGMDGRIYADGVVQDPDTYAGCKIIEFTGNANQLPMPVDRTTVGEKIDMTPKQQSVFDTWATDLKKRKGDEFSKLKEELTGADEGDVMVELMKRYIWEVPVEMMHLAESLISGGGAEDAEDVGRFRNPKLDEIDDVGMGIFQSIKVIATEEQLEEINKKEKIYSPKEVGSGMVIDEDMSEDSWTQRYTVGRDGKRTLIDSYEKIIQFYASPGQSQYIDENLEHSLKGSAGDVRYKAESEQEGVKNDLINWSRVTEEDLNK